MCFPVTIQAAEPTIVKSQNQPAETFNAKFRTAAGKADVHPKAESRRQQLLNQIKNQ
jgi:hypothetical protein